WSEVFKDLAERGLSGVRYVVSDDHKGLVAAIKRHFQGVLWQRCQVHFVRNVLGHVRKGDRKRVLELLRGITNARSLETAREALRGAVKRLNEDYPQVAGMLDEHGEEILAVYQLPEGHRKRMRSTNMVERLNQEFRRRTRVVRIFPDEASCIRLSAALAMEINEEWMERRYLDMEAEDLSGTEAAGKREAA
ncbi:MAG: transposase, partial [Planctomycetes bacterium]|nr:transposase [Planctomycetota bacterium]